MDIRNIVDRINENSKLLAEGHISAIDRDILLSDLRELYLLAKGQTTSEAPVIAPKEEVKAPVIVPEIKVEAPVVVPEVKVEAPVVVEETKPEPIFIPVLEERDVVVHKEEVKEIVVEQPARVVSNRIHYHEGSPVREPRGGSLNEVFVGEERSINTVLGGGEKKQALNDRLNRKDLKGLIDFNKQHVLTNELFGGDSAAFQSAISHINDCPTIEAAFEYIKTGLLPKYKWNGELQSTRLFDKLVRQKFGV